MKTKQELDKEMIDNNELVTRHEIDKTPFTVIGIKEGFFGTMGKYRITEIQEKRQDVIDELSQITWDRIVQVMLLLVEEQRSLTLNKEK